jgi:class 3 adenylate cyclase
MTAVTQPSGTVTLVFTDIEGSTKLLRELGTDAYREALAEHRRIVRQACARYQGYEVDYEGDAFFYAFSSATAFQADGEDAVRRFHEAALAAGGTDNGAPGERSYHPGYFAAYVLDPDGNNIEAVFHGPAQRSAVSVVVTPAR